MDFYYTYVLELIDFNEVYFGNTLIEYLIALGFVIILYIFIKIFRLIILKKLKKLSSSTDFKFDEFVVENINSLPRYFYWALYLYFPLKYLYLPENIDKAVDIIFLVIVLLQATRVGINFVQYILNKALLEKEDSKDNITTFNLLVLISKIVIWATAILLLLMNMGFEITPLLASLGVGGVAVAFALQNILQDIFSSISIYLDKPFKIGDFISIGDDFGTVEKIGIKTTRLRTLQGQQLIISNRDMTNAKVNNYGLMQTRRIVFSIGVVYETPIDKLKKIPDIVRDIFSSEELSDAELQRVHFKSFGDFSLDYEIVYTMQISDFNRYMDAQEYINFRLLEIFKEEGIDFAYPTQVIHTKK